MKLIKILITMTLLNSLLVMGIVNYSAKQQIQTQDYKEPNVGKTGLDTHTILAKSPQPTTTVEATVKPVATITPVSSKTPLSTPTPNP